MRRKNKNKHTWIQQKLETRDMYEKANNLIFFSAMYHFDDIRYIKRRLGRRKWMKAYFTTDK